jgi:cupin fold WbuC family metalloprotein
MNLNIKSIDINNCDDVLLDTSGVSSAYFCLNDSIVLNQTIIEDLKDKAVDTGKDIRLCLHQNSSCNFHNMIIIQHRINYYPPHKHPFKAECYHLIEGELGAIHYNETGGITKVCKLSTDSNFIYRTPINEYHVIFPISKLAVYHESKPGPFNRDEDFVEPKWSPSKKGNKAIENYLFNNQLIFK